MQVIAACNVNSGRLKACAMDNTAMKCRDHCAACCIAPSISSPIPGMPVVNGVSKPAGVRCVQLDADDRCKIFGQPERPAVCGSLQPSAMMCGDSREQAMHWLGWMERETAPGPALGPALAPRP